MNSQVQMTAEQPRNAFFEIVQEALGVLEDERRAFLTGAYEAVSGIVERKQTVLAQLESIMPTISPTESVVSMMRRLIEASRRNELIIQAARQGLAHAKRRIAAIRDAGRGVVAYAEDGTRIASRADLLGSGKSA